MTNAKLQSAIIAAGVSRNIIEEGAPVTDETLLSIVSCLAMGPKQAPANTTEQALKTNIEWSAELQKRLIARAQDEEYEICQLMAEAACCLASISKSLTAASAEAATPVAWMVGYSVYRTKHEAEQNVRNPDLPLVPLYTAAPQASQPIGQPSGYVPLSVDGKSVFIDGAGEVPLCSAECKKPVSGAMTDERAKHDAWFYREYPEAQGISKGLYTMSLEGWKARALLSASGQAGQREKAHWTLHQISQIDPKTGSIGTAVMMAKEALASTPAQQTEEKKGEQQ